MIAVQNESIHLSISQADSKEPLFLSQLLTHALLPSQKIILQVEAGAQVLIINDIENTDGQVQSIDCIIADYAQVTFIQNQSQHMNYANITQNFFLGAESSLSHSMLLMGAQETDLTLDIFLQKQNAHAQLYGLYALSGTQRSRIKTRQLHQHAYTTSNLLYKGLLTGSSSAAYEGLIMIDQNATGSNAGQYNKNLILNKNARAQSIPSLEVLTNDVQCKHGSAIGQLDKEQCWYMQSRGLTQEAAKKLAVSAFLADALHGITDYALKHEVKDQILKKIFSVQDECYEITI